MQLKQFKVDMRSKFSLNTGERVERGNWRPSFFLYHEVPFNGRTHQWLIVSYYQNVRVLLDGKEYSLTLKPVECEIKGMEDLSEPCLAKTLYKILNNQE